MKQLTLLIASLLLVACTTTLAEKSVQQLGYQQGNQGRAELTRAALNTALAGEVSDEEWRQYQQAFEQGRALFCQPSWAFAWGVQGNRYQGQCAGHPREAEFRYEAQRGWDRYMFPQDRREH